MRPPARIEVDRQDFDGATQTIWLSAGTSSVDKVVCRIVTRDGRTFEEAVQLTVA